MSASPGSKDSRGLRRGRVHAVMPDDSCSLLVDRRGDMGPGHFTCPISPEEVAERDAITAVCRPPWLPGVVAPRARTEELRGQRRRGEGMTTFRDVEIGRRFLIDGDDRQYVKDALTRFSRADGHPDTVRFYADPETSVTPITMFGDLAVGDRFRTANTLMPEGYEKVSAFSCISVRCKDGKTYQLDPAKVVTPLPKPEPQIFKATISFDIVAKTHDEAMRIGAERLQELAAQRPRAGGSLNLQVSLVEPVGKEGA